MTAADPLPDPLASLERAKRTYVVPDLKLLYISLAKNACTSIKWLVADLAGEDPGTFAPGLRRVATPIEGIHNRSVWRKTPRLGELDPEFRALIHPDNGWFVFAVVRDPRVRLFSAWENKFLLRSPARRYTAYQGQPWFPRVPNAPDDVAEDFASFVSMLEMFPDHPLNKDSHFLSQTKLLRESDVPYSRIYDISEMSEFQSDLAEHLKHQGRDTRVTLRRDNDTPLAANGRVFEGGVRDAIERIYAEDFKRFGHQWDFEAVQARPPWNPEAMRHAQSVIAMSERITELLATAARSRRRNRKLTRRIGRLEAAAAARRDSSRSLASVLRRRLSR